MKDLSLMPYLEPGDGKFWLNIAPFRSADQRTQGAGYPFQIASDTDPVSRLFRAEVALVPEKPVFSLFLLVQRDHYRYFPSELRPLNNLDVDRFWQHALIGHGEKNHLRYRLFPLQTDSDGRQLPFRPTFFCGHRRLYFHPPCPRCGEALELCKDEALLSSEGLMAYSTSLRRYLYCPDCAPQNADIYAFYREDTDPQIVKGREELVAAWRNIVTGRIESRNFPCAGCPEQTTCFGKNALSTARIIPFNFYPAHILAFDAMTVNAADFLSMISGAPTEEVLQRLEEDKAYGRAACLSEWRKSHVNEDLYLFDEMAGRFLEILYLKLSFLAEASVIMFGTDAVPMPLDIFSAFEALWVNLPDGNGMLPGFWSFKTDLLTVGPSGNEPDLFSAPHPAQIRCCLGIVWFTALVGNKIQPPREINEALAQFINRRLDAAALENLPLFAPENNFWDPAESGAENLPKEFRTLWQRTLSLGRRLLQDGLFEDTGEQLFLKDLETIRREIKELLFSGKVLVKPASEGGEIDGHIHAILNRIAEKWKSERKDDVAGRPPEKETLTQTVILTKNMREHTEKQAPVKTDNDLQETVILKAGVSSPLPPLPEAEDDLQETIIQNAGASTPASQSAPPARPLTEKQDTNDGEDDLSETLILRPAAPKDTK